MKRKQKRPYRSVKVNSVRVDSLLERTQSERLLVAIDVAKEKMVAAVLDEDERVLVTVKWSHPVESEAFYDFVNRLGAERRLEVVMEPTGTYGDALRFHLRKRNVAVYQVSPKLVHDARELYDGVPSCHDSKSCGIIGMLHLNGRSRLFEGVSAARRRMKAATSTLYRYEKQFIRERCQLAAMLARFWPGLTDVLSVGTKSLLTFLSEMGSAAAVAADPNRARQILLKASKKALSVARVEEVLDNAASGYGEVPCPEEVDAMRLLAGDALRTRERVGAARKTLESMAVKDEATKPLIHLLGKATSGALVAEAGDLRDFDSPASVVRFFGLNLKEVSSGQFKGRLRITKRGSSRARHYLFYAALRLIYRDRIVRAWVAKKRARSPSSGLNGVVAVMRKLALALWHVARGNEFDAEKLYDIKHLNLTTSAKDVRLPIDGVDEEQLDDAA